jgi:hypothetical protein
MHYCLEIRRLGVTVFILAPKGVRRLKDIVLTAAKQLNPQDHTRQHNCSIIDGSHLIGFDFPYVSAYDGACEYRVGMGDRD